MLRATKGWHSVLGVHRKANPKLKGYSPNDYYCLSIL